MSYNNTFTTWTSNLRMRLNLAYFASKPIGIVKIFNPLLKAVNLFLYFPNLSNYIAPTLL